MSEYIFRFPADTPPLTYSELAARCEPDGAGEIGTTVHLRHAAGVVVLWLYDTSLAHIYPDRVDFTEHGDRHMATTEWLYRIVRDNGIGYGVVTDHFVRYVSRHDGRAPLEGHAFSVAVDIAEANGVRR